MRSFFVTASIVALSMASAAPAVAADLAIFGANSIGTLYDDTNTVTYVTDADLATAGYLSAFDAFIYTRNGSDFGVGLSEQAAANVKAFVKGNVVLFNGDFQDDIGDAGTNALFNNALAYVLAGTGPGYIGEYTGAFSAYSSNGDGYNPIGLIQGTSGLSGFAQGGSDGDINLTAAGQTSSITAGTPFPYNPAAVEYGAQLSGENPTKVLARFENGNAAIIASGIGQISAGVPEPSTWAMMVIGFGAVGGMLRRGRRHTVAAFA